MRLESELIHAIAAMIEAKKHISVLNAKAGISDQSCDVIKKVTSAIIEAKDALPVVWPLGAQVECVDNEGNESNGKLIGIFPCRANGKIFDVAMHGSVVEQHKMCDVSLIGPAKYKAWEDASEQDGIYVGSNGVTPISKWHFIKIMDGDEDAARELFNDCTWQCPETFAVGRSKTT